MEAEGRKERRPQLLYYEQKMHSNDEKKGAQVWRHNYEVSEQYRGGKISIKWVTTTETNPAINS